MHAIRFEVFGDPSVLELAEVPAPAADENTAVVRVMAASINPSDVKNVAGGMKQTTLPLAGISPASSRQVRPNGSEQKFGAPAAMLALSVTAATPN